MIQGVCAHMWLALNGWMSHAISLYLQERHYISGVVSLLLSFPPPESYQSGLELCTVRLGPDLTVLTGQASPSLRPVHSCSLLTSLKISNNLAHKAIYSGQGVRLNASIYVSNNCQCATPYFVLRI